MTPDAAERLYAMLPNARTTAVLDDVHHWTGFANAFTHLHAGLPADNPRVVLTAVLADTTNMGLTRMADACSVASYRELAWNAGWYLREAPTARPWPSWATHCSGTRSPPCSGPPTCPAATARRS